MPKKREGKKAGYVSGLLDRTSVYMDRIGDGTSARIQFKTAKAAVCELSFFAQEPGAKPTREEPGKAPCAAADGGKTEFTEKIEGLKTDLLYFVIIRVWEPGGSRDKAEQVTVQETRSSGGPSDPGGGAGGGDTGGGDTSGGGSDPTDGRLPHIWVARMNVPLRVAEVHKHDFAQPTEVAAIKQLITLTPGCQEGVPEAKSGPMREAAKDIQLQGLTSQDFAAATAQPHPDAEGRLQLRFASLNDGLDKWTLLYKLAGKDFRIPVRPISRILNMEMESSEIIAFDEPQLAEAVDPLKLDPAKPLKFKWTLGSSLADQSYLTIQIGRAEDDKAVYCVFPAEDRAGSIEPKFLQGLEDGRHVVLAELVSHQIWLKYGWLATVYDWRSGRVEK
jgi:hypothetical protein